MTTRKNILILGHNYGTQFIDICNQYALSFDPVHYHVTVAYLSGAADETIRARTHAEEVIFFNFRQRDIRGAKLLPIKKLITLCRERQFSTVIAHRYKPIYVMLWTAYFCKIPQLFCVMHAMHTLKSLPRKLLIAALAQPSIYFAGVSQAVRDDLRPHLWRIPNERVLTLYNCIDIPTTESRLLNRQTVRDYFQIAPDAFVLGTVARLAPEKDHQNLLRAFAKIAPLYPHAILLLMGDGPLMQSLKLLAQQLKISQRILFCGFVPNASHYMRVFDTFVLCSTKEAFGRVLLEAMTANIPVIGTKTDGIPEVIADAGLLVDAGDPDQLAQAMQTMLTQTPQEHARSQQIVYEHVEKNFSLTEFKKTFEKLLLVGPRSP